MGTFEYEMRPVHEETLLRLRRAGHVRLARLATEASAQSQRYASAAGTGRPQSHRDAFPPPPQFNMCCTDGLMSTSFAPRAIFMRSARVDTEPCAQQDPQYCGMCLLRLSVKFTPSLSHHVNSAGKATNDSNSSERESFPRLTNPFAAQRCGSEKHHPRHTRLLSRLVQSRISQWENWRGEAATQKVKQNENYADTEGTQNTHARTQQHCDTVSTQHAEEHLTTSVD